MSADARRVFFLVYAASGAAALIYEVTWVRLLGLQIGHSITAASTVLAAFMGGLAIGSAIGGRVGEPLAPRAALAAYSGIEIVIAALALLLPLELSAAQPLLARLYADGNSQIAFPLLRLALCLGLLAVPTAFMGATFPIACRALVASAERVSIAGRLYTANTIGAAGGALLAGFVLLPAVGIHGTTRVAVLLNVTAAAAAWLIASRAATELPEQRSAEVVRRRSPKPGLMKSGTGLVWIAAISLGVSGFASMTLQVVWTRMLALILGPTTYAFSVIVAVFISGLALGSSLATRWAARSRRPLIGLAFCLLLSVGSAAVVVRAVNYALMTMADVAVMQTSFGDVLWRQVLLVAVLLGPMAVAFGAAFPFAVIVGARNDKTVVADLGLIYAVNTVGAIAGALLAGFVLIPRLGLHDTIRLVILVVGLGTFALLIVARRANQTSVAGFAGCGLVLLLSLSLPSWNEMLLSSGVYKYAAELGGDNLETWLGAGRLLYYREGATATVSVREAVGITSLSIDGKVDASNVGDMLTQRLLAHLPLLLHPVPRRVAIIGLGSGVTLGSALKHPVTHVDALEISPEVVEASRFFESENHRALADPRTRLIVGDGRSHFMLSKLQYDVIISEPSNPWMAGVASLFTREFFESARLHLAPGGILCQWAHTYDMREDDLRSIVATFLSVFPSGSLWLVGQGDVLMVGAAGPLDARFAEIPDRLKAPEIARDLAEVGVRDPFALLSLFVADGKVLSSYAAHATIQTDDRMALEFSGPRSIFGRQANRNDDALDELRRSGRLPGAIEAIVVRARAADWRNRGWMLLGAEAYESASRDFMRALEVDQNDADAYEGLRRASVAAGDEHVEAALTFLRRRASDPLNVDAGLALSRFLAARGAADEAVACASDLFRRHPDNPNVVEQLASLLSDAGDADRLRPLVARLRRDAPTGEGTRYQTASLLFMEGRPDLAVDEAQSIVRDNPRNALAQNLLGAALASLGERDRARGAFEASLQVDRLSPSTYTNLAMLEMETGNAAAAARRYAEALTLNPGSEAARRGFAEATGHH